jgi:hypothetical protein
MPDEEAPLPPELAHLAFLFEWPDTTDFDVHEFLEFYRQRLADLKKHRPEIEATGRDIGPQIAEFERIVEDIEQSFCKWEDMHDKFLHAAADLADRERDLVKVVGPIVDKAFEEKPFDAEVQNLKEHLDEFRKHMPKDL